MIAVLCGIDLKIGDNVINYLVHSKCLLNSSQYYLAVDTMNVDYSLNKQLSSEGQGKESIATGVLRVKEQSCSVLIFVRWLRFEHVYIS